MHSSALEFIELNAEVKDDTNERMCKIYVSITHT